VISVFFGFLQKDPEALLMCRFLLGEVLPGNENKGRKKGQQERKEKSFDGV
jgi:hypothetical protein